MSQQKQSSALIRATLFVRDLERATAFYQALGLSEVYFEGTLDDPSACAILGLIRYHPYRVRIVKRLGPNYGMIGLFELPAEVCASSLPLADGPARLGEVALVFYVRDLDDTLTRLRARGALWSQKPQLFRMQHRAQAEVCLRDCDGVLINLVETDPDEQERSISEMVAAKVGLR